MEMQEVNSSMISSIGWDRVTGLTVQFKNGSRYQYSDVPESEYRQLERAPSIGKHFKANIQGKYDGIKL